jgi:hypothetical protein
MYEPHTHRLLPWPQFLRRAFRHFLIALGIIGIADGIGVLGYSALGGLGWVDAFLNASMILGGMGPVDRMETTGAKLFAACYALFSGLAFIAIVGVVLAPWMHRLVHKFHLQ